ncbi:hypothetical protein GCM10020370_42910 [Paenibacillus hodogayensis]
MLRRGAGIITLRKKYIGPPTKPNTPRFRFSALRGEEQALKTKLPARFGSLSALKGIHPVYETFLIVNKPTGGACLFPEVCPDQAEHGRASMP